MYKFKCEDMGFVCNFSTAGATVEEVKQTALTHAQEVHSDVLSKMAPAQQALMVDLIATKIKQK